MKNWEKLTPELPTKLGETRQQCHHAAQFIPRVTRAYLPARPDDSHNSMQWDPDRRLLTSEPIPSPQGEFRLGLRLRDLTLVAEDEFPLSGRKAADAMAWLENLASGRGLDPAPLSEPLHYEIPDHPVTSGASFGVLPGCEELERYYSNAAAVLSEISEAHPIRCWPHHFDIAGLITISGSGEQARTIGVGLSPGDHNYPQPYFYVTPWPYPPADTLPNLTSGLWHTEGWVGAILVAEKFGADAQQATARRFLAEATMASRDLLAA